MKLSVIIVNWNTEDLLRQTLDSVFRETKDLDFEVIVVDNNSTRDDSVKMVKDNFPQVVLIENKENLGFSKANNQGMRLAKGDYLMLLNSDVIVLDKALSKLVAFLEANKEIKMVGPKLLNADMTFQHACRRNLPNPKNSFYHLFGLARLFKDSKKFNAYRRQSDNCDKTGETEALSGAAMMFGREVYEKIGGLDEDFFMYGEDLDFCKRVSEAFGKIYFVSDAEIIHLYGASSKKRKIGALFNFYDAMWFYYKKHFYKESNFIFNFIVWVGIKIRLAMALIINFLK